MWNPLIGAVLVLLLAVLFFRSWARNYTPSRRDDIALNPAVTWLVFAPEERRLELVGNTCDHIGDLRDAVTSRPIARDWAECAAIDRSCAEELALAQCDAMLQLGRYDAVTVDVYFHDPDFIPEWPLSAWPHVTAYDVNGKAMLHVRSHPATTRQG